MIAKLKERGKERKQHVLIRMENVFAKIMLEETNVILVYLNIMIGLLVPVSIFKRNI